MLTEGRGIVERIEFDGMELSIEVKAGDSRTGKDRNGTPWEQTVTASYGYIKGTNSPDGEHLDCWVRKNPKRGARIYVVHQLTVDGSKFDEDKVMLGYSSEAEATKAFKANCFKPQKMFGGVSEFEPEHFKVIAFMARKSKIMLASQKAYDKFSTKGLLPKGIKSPIQLSQIVKESLSMALNVSYKSSLIAESAFELARDLGLNVLKSHNDVIFESESQLGAFIKYIDESQEDAEHLGDLGEMLPEDFQQITESNLTDAIDDLKSELKANSDAMATLTDIAADYGLDPKELSTAFVRATNFSVDKWAEHRDGIRRSKENAKQAQDAEAARAKAEKTAQRSAAAKARYAANNPNILAKEMASMVIDRIGDVFPDGDPYDVMSRVIRKSGLDWDTFNSKYKNAFDRAWKAATNTKDPHEYLAQLWDDYSKDNPEDYGDHNPYRESIGEGYIGGDPYEVNARQTEEAVKELSQILDRDPGAPVLTVIEGLADDYNVHPDDIYEAFTHSFGMTPEAYVSGHMQMESLLSLAGIKSQVTESRGTPTVHAVKAQVVSLNETHNTALRAYMIGYAVKKQRALKESVSHIDMDAALRRFANTALKYPSVAAETILEKVAETAADSNVPALREHISATTGLSVEDFRNVIGQRKWAGNVVSRQVFESLMEATEALWDINNPDKGTAFIKACM